MSANNRNRLKTTVSAVASSGLGAFTISTASSGYRSFVAGDDGLTFDGVLITEGAAWEVRDGCVYTHSGTSLSRGTLMDSSTGSAIAFTSAAVVSQGGAKMFADMALLAMASTIPGGRLTLQSGVPVSTTDQTAKTSIYYTPFVNNVVPLWDGYKWRPIEFSETTLALGTLTSGKPYDVFGYISGGALALESLVWTDDTTRATAVTLQDGRYCKSGDKTRLLLGTFYTTSTTTTEDSAANRYVANVYNKEVRKLNYATGDAGHTYNSATVRSYNNSTSNRVNFVAALSTSAYATIGGIIIAAVAGSTGDIFAGVDSTTTQSTEFSGCSNGNTQAVRGALGGTTTVAAGKHFIQILERGNATNAPTYAFAVLAGGMLC
jgi:hypothetical protein